MTKYPSNVTIPNAVFDLTSENQFVANVFDLFLITLTLNFEIVTSKSIGILPSLYQNEYLQKVVILSKAFASASRANGNEIVVTT